MSDKRLCNPDGAGGTGLGWSDYMLRTFCANLQLSLTISPIECNLPPTVPKQFGGFIARAEHVQWMHCSNHCLHNELDAAAFHAAWSDGHALKLDEALALAPGEGLAN